MVTPVCALRQGGTLALDLRFRDDLGAPFSIAAPVVATVHFTLPGGSWETTASVVPGNALGVGTITADTTGWPVGLLRGIPAILKDGSTTLGPDPFWVRVLQAGI